MAGYSTAALEELSFLTPDSSWSLFPEAPELCSRHRRTFAVE